MSNLEIGSEFWHIDLPILEPIEISKHCAFLLSGRSALDFVCRDSKITNIVLPSYCCSSMIEPFFQNGMHIHFYNIGAECTTTPSVQNSDAVLVIDYFGYTDPIMEQIAKQFHEIGKIVIYDSTHRLSGNRAIQQYADYSILSYRKWYYCNYALAIKHNGPFSIPLPTQTNESYLLVRDEAARMKAAYITKGLGEKQAFLKLFSQADSILRDDYANYKGIPTAINETLIIEKRLQNAKNLIDGVLKMKNVRLWKPDLSSEDTPLFVPILLKDAEERSRVRNYLVSHNIYCPIHWPVSELHAGANSELYQRELSLICDQRYGKEEMNQQLSVLADAFS